jgi:LEA14-like dessication related protein
MRKKTIAILFVIVTIIYIIVGAFLFLDIQIMETPEIIIEIEVNELSSEEAILRTIVDIYNPNGFEIIAKNLEVVTTTPNGYKVAHVSIKGGRINSHEKKTFTNDVIIAFNGHSPELLTSKITGEVGANILFIKKTIPLNIGVVTSIENLINELTAPSVSVTVDFLEITTECINITAIMDIYNPNSFDIFINDIIVEITSEEGKKIGDVDVSGGVVVAKDYLQLNSNGTVLLEALNAEMLILNMSGTAGVKIAGFEKNLSFNIQTRVVVPDLEEILLSKDAPTFLSIKLDEKFTLRGIIFYVGLEINNSYKVDLVVKNLTFRIYTVVDDTNRLIGENDKLDEILAKAGSSGFFSCEILVPYSKILPIDWSIDWMMASVTGGVSIKGVNQSAFLEIRGYLNLHPFR